MSCSKCKNILYYLCSGCNIKICHECTLSEVCNGCITLKYKRPICTKCFHDLNPIIINNCLICKQGLGACHSSKVFEKNNIHICLHSNCIDKYITKEDGINNNNYLYLLLLLIFIIFFYF